MNELEIQYFASAGSSVGSICAVHGFGGSTLQNWEHTGWVKKLTTAGFDVYAVSLPLHLVATAPKPAQSSDVKTLIEDFSTKLHEILTNLPRPLMGLGFSYGARIIWDLLVSTADSPIFDATILIGFGTTNHMAQAALELNSQDEGIFHQILKKTTVPKKNLVTFARTASTPFNFRAGHASAPTMLIYGEKDGLATGVCDLAQTVRDANQETEVLCVPGRDHISVLTSGQARAQGVSFLVRHL